MAARVERQPTKNVTPVQSTASRGTDHVLINGQEQSLDALIADLEARARPAEVDGQPTNMFVRKFRDAISKFRMREGPNLLWLKEKEDDTKLLMPAHDGSTGIPTLSRHLADFTNGLAALGGLPHAGKSTVMVNMMMDALDLNTDLMVLDFSYDDEMDKRSQQMLAQQTGLSYQQITVAMDITDAESEKLEAAKAKIEGLYETDRLRTYSALELIDVGDGKLVERNLTRLDNMLHIMSQARAMYPDRKIVAFIDAFQDLSFETVRNGSEFKAWEDGIKELKMKTELLDIMCWANAHLVKLSGRIPHLNDFKGSGYFGFAFKYASVVRNSWAENPYSEDVLMHEMPDGRLLPCIVLHNVKNKVSCWKGPLIYGLDDMRCQLIPLTRPVYDTKLNEYQQSLNSSSSKGRER